jgi:Ca2+-binding EF-hand superfamily protein
LLDNNGDGKLSRQERSRAKGEDLREVLDRADLDQDGFVTREELMEALFSGGQ